MDVSNPPPSGLQADPRPSLRALWPFVRPHRWVLLGGLALSTVSVMANLVTPMATKWILDGLAASTSLRPWILLLVGLVLVVAVLGLVQWLLLGRLAERIVLAARTAMVRRLYRARLAALSGRSSGELVTRVTSDTTLLRDAAASSTVEAFAGVVTIVGALVLMATLDWVLLLTTAGALAVVAIVVGVMMPTLGTAQHHAQAAVARLGGVLDGGLRAIRTVKSSRAEDRESERVLAEARESARQRMRVVLIEAVTWSAAGAGFQSAILLILALGAWRVETGALSVSALVAFLLYAFLIVEPVTTLAQTASVLQSGMVAASRIREVEALPVEDGEPAGRAAVARAVGPVVSFSDVAARYAPGAPPALVGVTLDVARTGHTAIVGPSGAGKTTLLSLLLRFIEPERGEITLDGVPLRQYSLAEVRGRIVYVEQQTPLLPGTLRENLAYTFPEATTAQLWAALRAVHLEEWARGLGHGLDTPMFEAAVSGGERQRIALARASVSEPEILLLDEATAQLDGLTENAVQEVIGRVASRGAVLTIAHRLSTVIDADQIIVMEAGRCRAIGTHAELLKSDDLYRDLVAALRIAGATRAGDLAPAG